MIDPWLLRTRSLTWGRLLVIITYFLVKVLEMSTVNLRKELKEFYTAKKKPGLVEVPDGVFLTILGKGHPSGEEYPTAMMALYSCAYTLKFKYKAEGIDYSVMPLEGLWWIEDGVFDANKPAPGEKWRWRSMIQVPDFVTEESLAETQRELVEKKGEKVLEVKLESFSEGLAAQVMHIGPYSEETPTINLLHTWVEENGYKLRDDHHEIYLNNPQRTKPENLKTIIRHPVERV